MDLQLSEWKYRLPWVTRSGSSVGAVDRTAHAGHG